MGYVEDRIKNALRAAKTSQNEATVANTTAGAQSGSYTQNRINRALQTAQKAQQRAQTIQSMQTKKAELDERKLGVSYAPTGYSQQPQEQPQYISPAPIVWTLDSAVSPIIKQNSKVSQQYATAMPNTSLIQQATENYRKWNQQYEQDQDQYLDDVDRVSTLSGMGTSDAEANRRLEQSSEKLSRTQAQWNETMRQTLDMLGPGTENLIRSRIKDAQDKRTISGENDLTDEDREKYQRSLKAQELSKLLGSELFREVTEYVRQQENAVRMQRKVDAASEIADEHGIVASLNSVPKKIVGGVAGTFDTLTQGVDRLFSGSHAPLDWNTDMQTPGREANAIRSTVAQNIREDTGGEFWPFIYNTGMSMADSAAVMPLGGWGSVVLGTAAGNDLMQEAKATGASDDQAIALGLIGGVTEVLTEKVSIDSLFNLESPKKITDILWNAAKQAIPEASEEAISEIVGSIADVIIMGDKSEFKTKMREYEARGYNRDQAMAMALGSAAGDVALSAAGGALSGFAFGGIKSTGDYAINKISDFSNKINEIVETDQPQYRTNINITEQQNAQAQTRQDARQNATATDFAQEQAAQRTIDPSGYRQTAQQILNENIFESQTYGTAMEETELTRGEVRQALRDIARGNQSKVTDSNVQTVLQAIQAVENNLPASETTQVQEAQQPQQTQERQQIIPDDTAREQLNEAQLGALRDLAQQNTQAQTRQDARQNATPTDFAQKQPGLEQTMQEPQTAKAPLSERAQQLAQRMAALGEDGETAVELARDIEGYFWGDVEDEATVQRLANNPAAVTVMEQLLDQGIHPSIKTQAEEGQQTAQDQTQQDQLNGPILDTLQELDRQKRAANARNETERTGILAGATTEQIEQAQRIGELVGREVAFFAEGKDASGGLKNGYFNQKDGRIYVNVNSQNPIAQIVSHELTHSVEGNTFYNKLRQAVLKKIKADGVNLNTLRTEKQALYERHGVTDVDVDAEIVAEYVEKNLLTDEESILRLVLENRTLGQRIMEFIDKLLAKLGNKKAQEREFLSKARRYYADALAESQSSGTFGQQEQVRNMERLQEQMASGELTEDEAWQVFNEIYDAELDLQNGLRGNQYSYSQESADVDTETSRKEQQFEIIQNSNVAEDDYHTWIRDASEIKTLSETLADPEWAEYSEYDPDYTRQMAEDAIESGKIKVYSSYQIGNGTFVSPSRMEAESYSGNGRVYEKTVNVDDVAWIDPTQGQYAPVKNVQYSISEIEGEKQDYGPGVILDTKVFNGVRPRDWGKVLGNYVYQNMAGTELTMYDEYGNPETVYLARENDRVKKDGTNRSHKVLDKLAGYRGDQVRAKSIIQLSEVLETSRHKEKNNSHNHQWMDENGWEMRTVYLQDKSGNIYEATVNIADGRERKILYEISRVHQIDKIKSHDEHTATDNGQRFRYQKPGAGRTQFVTESSIQENVNLDKGKFSISEEENLSDLDREQLAALESMKEGTRQAETEQLRQALPVKARQYLARAERVLLTNVQNALGVDKFSDKAGLMGTIQEISNEYLKHGKLTQERADALFEKAYKQGIVVEKEFYERYKGFKDKLRTTAVTLDPEYASSIPDVKDFRKAAFGRLRLVKEGGMSVDSLYQELQQQAPELFPAEITNPADQLVRMFEVAKSIQMSERNVAGSTSQDAQELKRWAKNDFDSAIADVASKLRNVNRYAQERAEKANAKKVPSTPQEAAKAYRELKNARWTMEKAKAKTLLTDADRMQVGRLLRGEIELSDLKPGKDNVQGIGFVYEASKEYDGLVKLLNKYKAQMHQNMQKKAAEYLKDAMDWKDKTAGILYSRETMERNIQDIAPDAQTADAVIKEYITPVHKSEAESTRFKNRYRDRVRALDLSQKVQKGNNVSEAYAVQLLGEAQDNIQRIENSKGRIKTRDGETAKTWKAIVNTLKKENPNLDWAKVENAVAEFRSIYNELFQQANEVRVRNGYEPVNYRGGYFPHFQAQGDSLLTRIGHAIGIDTQVQTLPTSINGLTDTFKPGTTWFKFGQQRKGHQTAYDAVAGFEQYIESVAPVIYQTDNIQNLRALATEIRRMTGDEGIRQQIDAIQMDQTLTEDEKRAKLEDVYKNGQYTLSNFVNELDEYTNLLANKKSKLDRSMEAMIGRRAYTIMKNFESRVGANMVAGNLASAFTNFVPLVQAWGQIDSGTLLHGMWDTLKAYKNDDGFVDQSTFLTNRRGSDPIIQTWTQKASKVAGTPMEYIDNFTSDSIVRARFRQNLRRGMSETLAMEEADAFAARVMADRSKGSMPTLFSSNNPLIKAFTQFQLEVNNQFSEVFKDLPRAYKDKGLAALTAALLKYFFGAYIYNEVYEKIVGRRPALDPFGILNDMVGDLTGYELPNLVTLAGNAIQGKETSFETEKVGLGEAGKNLTENVLGTLPFSSGLALVGVDLDGGRIPASSAIPDLTALWDATTTDEWSGKKRWNEAQQELNKLAYIIPPFGGSQFSKGVKTIKQLTNRGKYTVDAEGNDVLQYPIDDSLGNWVRSALFGTSSLPESQEYYDSGNKALTGEQTAVVRELEEQGVDQKTMYNLYQTLRQIGKEKKGAEASNAKRDAINALDLSDEQKLKVFDATMLDNESDKYEETLEQYQGMLDAGMSWDEITRADNIYAELKEEKGLTSSERARKMELWIDDQGWTEDQQEAVKSHVGVGQAAKGEGAYEYMKERIGNGTPPETVLQALTDAQQKNYSEYIQKANVSAEMYLDALSFASKAESDKDKDGKTISGSKKQKIVDWIDSQKLTKKQKRALFLCFYSESDNTFK